jgi:hypothetical protein
MHFHLNCILLEFNKKKRKKKTVVSQRRKILQPPSTPDSDTHEISLEKASTRHEHDPEALTRLQNTQSHVPPPGSLPQEIVFVSVVCMAHFMTQFGLCMSIAPVHIIGDSFRTINPADLSWFAADYTFIVCPSI